MSFLERRAIDEGYYHKILDTLKDVAESHKKNASLLIYGSNAFKRCDLKPGISDIDGIFYFNANFVIDKKILKEMNGYIASNFNIITPNPLAFLVDLAIIDKGIAKNGHFIPYGDNFSSTLAELHDVDITGFDFRREINLVNKVDPMEMRIGGGLNSLRKYLLLEHNASYFENSRYTGPFKCMQILLGFGRKIAGIVDNISVQKKADGVNYWKKRFSSVNISSIEEILSLNQDIKKLSDFMSFSKDCAYNLILEGTTAYEETLKKIIEGGLQNDK